MADTRTYALAIYNILQEYSDEQHILSNPEIITLLKSKYDIEMNQQTVLNNIKALIQFGIDIDTYTDNRKGYYLIDREFEDSEIQLLCNCIHSAHYIPEKASQEIIKKLCSKQSKYRRKDFINRVYITNYKKTKNKELLLNIDLLNEAISNKKAVKFQYLTYDYNRNLIPKRENDYTVFPYHIIQENDNLYLICQSDHHTNLSHFRIDKMKSIAICKTIITPILPPFDPYVYAKGKKFMFSDHEIKITLHCHLRMLDDLIDQFGRDIVINPDVNDKKFFFARITISEQGAIYFILQYLNFCEVVEPKYIRDKIISTLQKKLVNYLQK